MITVEEIKAQNLTPLTDEQILALDGLVQSYPVYAQAIGLFPEFPEKLLAEKTTPTVKTKKLKAILTKMSALPPIIVESYGTDKAQSNFSVIRNLNELAQDVLNTFYRPSAAMGQRSYVTVQRKVEDLVLKDNAILDADKTGRRF